MAGLLSSFCGSVVSTRKLMSNGNSEPRVSLLLAPRVKSSRSKFLAVVAGPVVCTRAFGDFDVADVKFSGF